MILTTAAKETELLGERARQSEGFGANRCPVYVDGARAQAWATASGAEEAKRLVVEHEASTRRNADRTIRAGAAATLGCASAVASLEVPDCRAPRGNQLQRP